MWYREMKHQTLPKAQRTRGLSSYHISSYTNLDQISISESRLSIDIKISSKHQYLDKSWSNLALAKIQLRNLNETSAAKYIPNFSFKISPDLQLDQTLCSKSEQKFSFMSEPQLPNLPQTVANTILIINISNIHNLNKFWVGIFTRQGHINQVY